MSAAGDRGLYVIWLRLKAGVRLGIGALGSADFPPGVYAYVGSAQRNRSARIQRHLRRDKTKRWHIDYLRPYAEVVAVTLCDGTKACECRLAEHLVQKLGAFRACLGFGASDCGCGGHLLGFPGGALPPAAREIGWPGAVFMPVPAVENEAADLL